jgi:hypothetical protein
MFLCAVSDGWQLCAGVPQLIQLDQQMRVRLVQITSLKHLTIKGNHLVNVDGIISADFRPDIVNPADVFLLSRQLTQPWTTLHFFARDGADPQVMAYVIYIVQHFWSTNKPKQHIDFGCRPQPIATLVFEAALSTLSTGTHG